MVSQRRVAKWFLLLACLVVLTCTTQRMASLHMASKYLPVDTMTLQAQESNSADETLSPCELSAKSLLVANGVAVEHLCFALLLFIALLLVPFRQLKLLTPPPHITSLPRLRVHLLLCVFQE